MYRPRHLKYVRDYLLSIGAILSDGCEADDLLGIEQCASQDTVIVSLDKDLLMIPGKHYSWEIRGATKSGPWVKPAIARDVSESEGRHWFWTQVLIGDTADNIKGAAGVGKVNAGKILAGCETEADYFEACLPHFSCEEELIMNAQVLWIWRKPNDMWSPPN